MGTYVLDENHLSCPLLNVFNYKYETWVDSVDQTVDLNNETVLIKVSCRISSLSEVVVRSPLCR